MRFSTRAIRAGQPPEPVTGSVIVPIFQTVTFQFEEVEKHTGYEYTRTGNPTRAALEECLAALEEARHGLAFASGSAATDAALSILRPGDRVVASRHLYGGTLRIFESLYRPRGIEFAYAETEDPAEFEALCAAGARMVWIETPTNPLLRLLDIREIGRIAAAHGALLVVDNTFATPFFQQPITLGADVVVHSTTKYINGHSDVLGGAVLTNHAELHEAFKFYQNAAGAVLSPFDSWLTLRGVKTLEVRMRRHEENALRVAGFLASHPFARSVVYPGLESHPHHALARSQMRGFGAIVTFELPGGRAVVNSFVKSLRLFLFAESLGGVESLVCHPPTMSHASLTEAERAQLGVHEGAIRLSVGIEDIEDLLEDLDMALSAAESVLEGRKKSHAGKRA